VSGIKALFGHGRDFYGLLADQARGVQEGLALFTDWEGDLPGREAAVTAAEERADQQRLAVSDAIGEAFNTPFDREDIEDLSHMLDDILDRAHRAAVEMRALEIEPDDAIRRMFAILTPGAQQVTEACMCLRSARKQAHLAVLKAKTVEGRMQADYASTMSELFASDDIKDLIKRLEVYRRVQEIGLQITVTAEFLRHLLVKLV
jgi:uncharacterized protein